MNNNFLLALSARTLPLGCQETRPGGRPLKGHNNVITCVSGIVLDIVLVMLRVDSTGYISLFCDLDELISNEISFRDMLEVKEKDYL